MSPRRSDKDKNGSHISDQLDTGAPFDKQRKADFLRAFAISNTLTTAAASVGVSRQAVNSALQRDRNFRALFDEAIEVYRDRLVTEMNRRAIDGVIMPVYFKGERIDNPGDLRQYSDRLLEIMIKRADPSFRDKTTVENHNLNVDVGAAEISNLNPNQRLKLRELLEQETKDDPPAL